MLRPLPRHTLFPYTTLFRSRVSRNSRSSPTLLDPTLRFFLQRDHLGAVDWIEASWPQRTSRPARSTVHRGRVRSSDRKSTRLNSSHVAISYAVFCLKKKNKV